MEKSSGVTWSFYENVSPVGVFRVSCMCPFCTPNYLTFGGGCRGGGLYMQIFRFLILIQMCWQARTSLEETLLSPSINVSVIIKRIPNSYSLLFDIKMF